MERSAFAAAAVLLAAVSQCVVGAQLADPPFSAGSHASEPVVMSPDDSVSFLAVCIAHPVPPSGFRGIGTSDSSDRPWDRPDERQPQHAGFPPNTVTCAGRRLGPAGRVQSERRRRSHGSGGCLRALAVCRQHRGQLLPQCAASQLLTPNLRAYTMAGLAF